MAREHAPHVAVENRAPFAGGERRDRRRGRAPDAGQRDQGFEVARKFAAVRLHHLSRREVEIARAAVIAEPAPQREHVVDTGMGERAHIGKARDEALVIRNDDRDLRLLQHDLREPDAIRVARRLPWKVAAAVALLPAHHARGE